MASRAGRPPRKLRATIEGNLRIADEQLLSAMNIPMDIVNRELAQMQSLLIVPATNRRVLGSMNELAFHLGMRQEQISDPIEMAVSLSGIPMSAVGSKSRYGIPRDVAHSLLVSHGH